jgi:hypothetical protein
VLALQTAKLRRQAVCGGPDAMLLANEILDGSLVGALGMIPQPDKKAPISGIKVSWPGGIAPPRETGAAGTTIEN